MEISFGQVAKFVWGYARRQPLALTIILLILIAKSAVEIAMPYLVGRLTDYISETPVVSSEVFDGAIVWLVAIFACGILFWTLNQFGCHNFYDAWKLPLIRDMTTDSFRNVQNFSLDWHANTFAGATVRKITRGSRAFETFLDEFEFGFVPITLLFTGIIATAAWQWPSMGWLIAIASVFYATISIFLAWKNWRVWQVAAKADTRVGATLADVISCDTTVKNFGREKYEARKFAAVVDDWRKKMWRAYFVNNTHIGYIQAWAMTLLKIGMFVFVVWLWANGQASTGDVVFIISVYALLSGHLRMIGQHILNTQRAARDMADLVEFDLTKPSVVDIPDAKNLDVETGTIDFENVTFCYPNQSKPIFKNFSIEIPAGQSVALVGHSGAGKSTFVKLVQRLYDVDSGAIKIDEQNIADVTQKSLRRAVGLVPQDPILFHRSLADNIAYGQPRASEAGIKKVARAAHAAEFIEKLDKKYETFVGERGVKLSGGERQRVAIARAMLADTPILILDEATSSLDSESESLIQSALQKLMKNRTTIVVAHRLSTIKSVDRILVFDGGKIVEDGSHAKLIRQKKGIYKKLYELQAGGFIGES